MGGAWGRAPVLLPQQVVAWLDAHAQPRDRRSSVSPPPLPLVRALSEQSPVLLLPLRVSHRDDIEAMATTTDRRIKSTPNTVADQQLAWLKLSHRRVS